MASSRSKGGAPTEEMATPSAVRAAPASSGLPVWSERRPAAAAVRVCGEAPTPGTEKSGGQAAVTAGKSGAPASRSALKVESSTAATPLAGREAVSAPDTPAG